MPNIEKLAIIGLDCAEPSLIFERWAADLPNLRRLAAGGLSGRLESCMPPITVPAWSCMASGKDPGALGVYGFRDRRDWSYENYGLSTNLEVRQPRLWDHLSRAGLLSIIVGVPQTFPIVHPPHGWMVTCFLTPSTKSPYTHPPELATEIEEHFGDYIIDAEGFRTNEKRKLLDRIYAMARQRFDISRHLARTRDWSLLWMVEMGVDRIHHGFWQYMDPQHRRYQRGNEFETAIHDYYVFIDEQIGAFLNDLDLDRTAVWVVSDHGAKRLDGGFCINDWLIREGLLTMKTPVTGPRRFELADVDWSKTQAWGEGGYCGRCFINRAGREPHGVVPDERYQAFRDTLIERIEALPGPDGKPLGNRAFKPEDVYPQINGVPPDFLILFGDLHWRGVGSIGHPELYTFDADAGPDDANHALQGMYILAHPSIPPQRLDASIYDVAPTSLELLGVGVPHGLRGRSLITP